MSYLLDPTLDYVSGADAQILFNNILIDECYDLQYSYREMKEPVYGYRSKRFDHVLPGTQIISGQFTINYVYDGYLTTALQTSKGILETTSPTEKDYAYAKLTGDYSKIRQSNKIKFNKQTLINNVQDITTARSKIDSLKAELNTLKGEEEENKKRPQITQIENEIKTLNDAIEIYIKNRKKLESENWNSIMDFMDYDKQLMDTNWITDYSTRAEDVGDSFDIYIRYNGASHKILRECYLTGHAHVIMMGGEPIKEIYTFFAKYIENGEYSYS